MRSSFIKNLDAGALVTQVDPVNDTKNVSFFTGLNMTANKWTGGVLSVYLNKF